MKKEDKPIKVVWDKQGYNQWGTKYIYPRPCFQCGSDLPTGNMYGMGTNRCTKCDTKQPDLK